MKNMWLLLHELYESMVILTSVCLQTGHWTDHLELSALGTGYTSDKIPETVCM